jgi:hypothetical protein
MPPKKKKKSRKTTQSQSQSQKVVVNIGTATAKRKRRGGGGAGPGGGGGYRHNLAPTIVNAPQVDYTPFLAMMQYQTRTLQGEGIANPVTPLSSATVANAEKMAGEAAIRRAGKTSADFSQQAHMNRREDEEREREAMGQEDIASTVPTSRSRSSSISTVATEIEEAVEPIEETKEETMAQETKEEPIAVEVQRKPNSQVLLAPLNIGPLKPSEDVAFVGGLNLARPKRGAPFTANVGNLPVGQALTPGRLVAVRQDFVPLRNTTGELQTAGTGTAATDRPDETPLREQTPRELIRQAGPLTAGEFNAYTYLQSRVDAGKELKPTNQVKFKVLRKRLEQFGSSKST